MHPKKASGAPNSTQEAPGEPRRAQEIPGEARRGRQSPGGASRAQESLGGARLDVVLAKLLSVLRQNCILYLHFINFAHISS